MCDGYDPSPKDDHPDLEDELLCEYVDGTMDPVVREVFDEYLRANPDLRHHVECLRNTRSLLCHYGCQCRAPRDLHDRLRRQITCDLVNGRVPFYILVADRLKGATMTSALAFLILLGLAGGLSTLQEGDFGSTVISAAAVTSPVSSFSDQQTSRDVIRLTPEYSSRMSSLGPRPSVRSFVSHRTIQMAPRNDTSRTLQLERSRLLP